MPGTNVSSIRIDCCVKRYQVTPSDVAGENVLARRRLLYVFLAKHILSDACARARALRLARDLAHIPVEEKPML